MHFVISGERRSVNICGQCVILGQAWSHRLSLPPGLFLEFLPKAAQALQPPSPSSGSSWQEIKGQLCPAVYAQLPTGPNLRPPVLDSHRKSPMQPCNRPARYHTSASGQAYSVCCLWGRAEKVGPSKRTLALEHRFLDCTPWVDIQWDKGVCGLFLLEKKRSR